VSSLTFVREEVRSSYEERATEAVVTCQEEVAIKLIARDLQG
jgi:hypothetical protein